MSSRMMRPVPWLLLGLAIAWSGSARAGELQIQPTLKGFVERLPGLEKQIPEITKSAEAAVDRMLAHPKALINVPYGEQQGFAEDIVNRSGGLANALPDLDRPKENTPDDIVLFSLRSWETDWPKHQKLVASYKERGWMIVLFASKAGMPADVKVDWFIDNGGTTPGEDQAALNNVVNVMNGWLWCCEYVSALSRRGRCPGILMGAVMADSNVHNAYLQSPEGRHWMGDAKGYVPVPTGILAQTYFGHVKELCTKLAGEPCQSQIAKAVDLISARFAAGKKVFAVGIAHVLLSEAFLDNKTPWQPFFVVWRAETEFPKYLKKGDLLLYIGFVGVSTPFEDYDKFIRQTGADVIASFVPDTNPENNAPYALARIDQLWQREDACVPVPCPPYRMAPLSGINAGLLYRMIDDAVSERLAALEKAGKYKPQPAPAAK